MQEGSGADRLAEGWRALDAAQWDTARAAFVASFEDEETPDALDGLGLALWFLGALKEGSPRASGHSRDTHARVAGTRPRGSPSGCRTST